MQTYEYRVVPSPVRPGKGKGSAESRFAETLAAILNAEARDGWEFLRAETLPRQERQGLTGSRRIFQTMLVFRRIPEPFEETVTGLLEDRSGRWDDPAVTGPAAPPAT